MTLQGVIFDMDGTLTAPAIDFAEMRRRLGIPSGDILLTIKTWSDDRRIEAFETIEKIEEEARQNLILQPGIHELLAFLDLHDLRKGIVTRNTAVTVRHLLDRLSSSFSEIVTREFEPFKPDPASIRHICGRWGVPPEQVMMVGDYRDDMLCGRGAGARTCLLLNDWNAQYASLADFVAPNLHAVLELVASLLAEESPR